MKNFGTKRKADLAFAVADPSLLPGSEHEVFLSFRGCDTRHGFTDCLYHALVKARVRTFRDDEGLRVGEEIGGNLLKAIRESKISIPVFSKNYASSKWCLKELAMMVERKEEGKQLILPVFYDVPPEQVQDQTGGYGEALKKHEEDGLETKQWREALDKVGHIKGKELDKSANGYQGLLIKLIVSDVLSELKTAQVNVTCDLVGVDDNVEACKQLLRVDAHDVRILVIWGLGGIGKTTLAKAIFNQILDDFESCSFIKDIREASRLHGLEHLQSSLVADLSRCERPNFADVDEGIKILKGRYREKKVLVVLDDVDNTKQLDGLVIGRESFRSGSTIIVTTRNENVLGTDVETYEVKAMAQDDALRLFCRHAFKKDTPTDELRGLSYDIVETTGRLPLALEVIGSSLHGESNIITWEKKLKKLKMVPDQQVQDILRVSFDALEHEEKQIFLDIACLFIGEDKNNAVLMWDDCDLFPEIGIKALKAKSLIRIEDNNEIWMHDQVRDLGREIVRKENYNKPQKRSRLWHSKEAKGVLTSQTGTDKVLAIRLDYEMGSQPYDVSGDKFKGLSSLRYLELGSAIFNGDVQGQLSNLKWLGWHCHTELHAPSNLNVNMLVVLDLSKSSINETWNGWDVLKDAKKLEVLDLTGCHRLKRTPDHLSSFLSMKRLILRDCIRLDLIDPSVGDLKMLILLDVRNCRGLKTLPEELGYLEQLNELLLDESSINEIPDNLGGLKNLETFSARSCKLLRRLPISFGSLAKVQKLLLDNCELLEEIPNTIGQLESLQELSLSCTNITSLPDPVEKWINLKVLNIDHCPIESLPFSLEKLMKLEVLNVSGCINLKGGIPFAPGQVTSLRILRLSNTDISTLPASIGEFPHLHTLDLEGCMNLQSLPRLPTSLINLKVNVTSSTTIPNPSELINLKHIELRCHQQGSDYEVFLSFRQSDTRYTFTDILYKMLTRVHINTFRHDGELNWGGRLHDKVLKAISQSQISIPIFSKSYARRAWCLNEAAQIVKCMEEGRQRVYPIFFDVDKGEVGNQTGEYEKAFRKHVESKNFDDNTIREWRDALRKIASLKGLHLKDQYDGHLGVALHEVISDILIKLEKSPLIDDLVGIDDHIVELKRKLDVDVNHVKILGIWGISGIGKTTIAKSLFDQFRSQFKHHSTLENVRLGTSLEAGTLLPFKRQLLFDISRREMNISSSTTEVSTWEASLKGKQMLILVDDVDTTEKLDYLIGERDWLGMGSIIIVTTRRKEVLRDSWSKYEVKPMHQDKALQLFCKHAFREESPLPGFDTLSLEIVEATGGHPLAIKTIGSYLYLARQKSVWEATRNILGTIHNDIHKTLKTTYDVLGREQKEIFLDIACLLKGADQRVAVNIWKAQNFQASSALEALLQRGLIEIRDRNILWMPDLFVELGQEIVRQESRVQQSSRLWRSEDAMKVLKAKVGTGKVKAIHLDCSSESAKCCFKRENVEELSNLEFLCLGDATLDLTSNFEGCLSSLKWLSWHGRNNLFDIPSSLRLKSLLILDLSKSMITDDWNGWSSIKEANNLEVLNLSGCHKLTKTPDFSSFLKMETLILEDCRRLVEIDSIKNLKALKCLDVRNCSSLVMLPQEFSSLVALTEILLDGSSILELPISDDMKKLETVSAKFCRSLTKIPSPIWKLKSLKEFNFSQTGAV